MTDYSDSLQLKRKDPAAHGDGRRYWAFDPCGECDDRDCCEGGSRDVTAYVTALLEAMNTDPVAPSSPEARTRGCTCLGGDTPEGNGLDSGGYVAFDDTVTHWVIAANCPVHARNLPSRPAESTTVDTP